MQNPTVHIEILNQLGGNQFLVMTGSSHLLYSTKENNFLSMHLRKNKAKAKFLKIVLEIDDTYTMIFSKVVKTKSENSIWKDEKLEVVKEVKRVYNDMLQQVFTEVTGLNTSLGTMGKPSPLKVKVAMAYDGLYSDPNGETYYKDVRGNIYTKVDGAWHICTTEGEPNYPIRREVVIEEN